MAKRPTKPTRYPKPVRPQRLTRAAAVNEGATPTLHLGLWLARLDREQQEVAKAAGIGKSYMSHLVSGKKKNPAARKLLRISIELGVTVNDLYQPPPPKIELDRLRKYSPNAIGALVEVG